MDTIEMADGGRRDAVHNLEADQKQITPTIEAQTGVQKIEAVTLAWSRSSLFLALGLYVPPPLFTFKFACPLTPVESGSLPSSMA